MIRDKEATNVKSILHGLKQSNSDGRNVGQYKISDQAIEVDYGKTMLYSYCQKNTAGV